MKTLSRSITYHDLVDDCDREKLQSFVYKGKDDSLLYKYFMSPLCDYLVANFVPEWMAPNLITLIGFMFVVIPHILIRTIAPHEDDVVPPWLYVVNGLGLYIYTVSSI